MIVISIIIPSYNSAHFIRNAIDSVLESVIYTDEYEIIVVDDGSSDNIKDVMELYKKHNNIILINQLNRGLSGARNTGIKNARGKYLVFLDADDIIMPDKLTKQFQYLESNSGVDIVYSNSLFFDNINFNNELSTNFPIYEGNILSNLLYGNFIHVNSVMVRKDVVLSVGGFDENFRELEDWDLWLRMSLQGSKFGYIPEVLSKVRVHSDSMTANQERMNEAMVRVLEKTIKKINSSSIGFSKLLLKAEEAKMIYLLMLNRRLEVLINLLKLPLSYGLSFIPLSLKFLVKLLINHKNINTTTKNLELIWKGH